MVAQSVGPFWPTVQLTEYQTAPPKNLPDRWGFCDWRPALPPGVGMF
jgi:hypothetical protein